jgi:regulatory protein
MESLDAPADVSPAEVRRVAMDLLARREHSFHELQQKLSRRFFDPDLISDQLNLLKDENLQSDERFVESFVNGRKSRGKGPMVIRHELKQKGIAAELVAMYLDDDPDEWLAIAQQTYRKKFGDKPVADQKDKARRLRFMQYRGFSGEIIRQLF